MWLLLPMLLGCSRIPEPVSYLEVSSGSESYALTLAIATPNAREHGPGPYPALVFIHGGGWRGGDLNSSGYGQRIRDAADQGYVATTINYRLTEESGGLPQSFWPAQIQDVKCAIRWLRANAETYAIDTHRIGTLGYSAGGHLSLMAGLTPGHTAFESPQCPYETTSEVLASSSRSGPADFLRMWEDTTDTGRDMLLQLHNLPSNHSPQVDPTPYLSSDPVSFVEPSGVPVLQLQGLLDGLVPPTGARSLHQTLQDTGRESTLIEFENTTHGWLGAADTHADEQELLFFDRHLKDQETTPSCSPWPSCTH